MVVHGAISVVLWAIVARVRQAGHLAHYAKEVCALRAMLLNMRGADMSLESPSDMQLICACMYVMNASEDQRPIFCMTCGFVPARCSAMAPPAQGVAADFTCRDAELIEVHFGGRVFDGG